MDKDMILHILDKANFSKSFISHIQKELAPDYIAQQAPYAKEPAANPLLQLDAHERVLETVAQLLPLKAAYEEKGIPLPHLYKSIFDLSYRIERYKKTYGTYGLSERDIRWLTPIFRLEIFDIGSLRFQMSHFSFEEIERSGHEYMKLSDEWERDIPEGTPIITLHIMKDAPITPDKVAASFKEAVPFFDHYFPEHAYDLFVCRTWLIYKPIQALLPETSNITAFANLFTIIAQNKNTKQALERIYGTSDLEAIEKMDKHSSLQEKVHKNLKLVGEATGIIYKSDVAKY